MIQRAENNNFFKKTPRGNENDMNFDEEVIEGGDQAFNTGPVTENPKATLGPSKSVP